MGLRVSRRLPRVLIPAVGIVLLAAVCGAPQTKTWREPDQAARIAAADRFLEERLALWQKRLQLADWNVRIVMSRKDELRPGTVGSIRWDSRSKKAVMRVLKASEYKRPMHETLSDMEFTIVHELLHLELASLPRSEASRSDEEHTINRLASSLLKMERGY